MATETKGETRTIGSTQWGKSQENEILPQEIW